MDNLNLIDNDINLNNNSPSIDDIIDEQPNVETSALNCSEITNKVNNNDTNNLIVENKEECTALVELKPHGLLVAQTMFKKSIKISIKSFLISLSLGFLNLFF